MRIITLITDLGSGSPQAGALHGLIWRAAPTARIVELTHEISPGSILEAQVVLEMPCRTSRKTQSTWRL